MVEGRCCEDLILLFLNYQVERHLMTPGRQTIQYAYSVSFEKRLCVMRRAGSAATTRVCLAGAPLSSSLKGATHRS
jgi:hypothetical protein